MRANASSVMYGGRMLRVTHLERIHEAAHNRMSSAYPLRSSYLQQKTIRALSHDSVPTH
jgi:Gpi18-like mannosyltransferase